MTDLSRLWSILTRRASIMVYSIEETWSPPHAFQRYRDTKEIRETMNATILLQPWAPLYQAALLEFEPSKLIKRIDLAEIAITARLQDLRLDSDHHEERQLIADAQGALRYLRRSA